MTTQLPDTLVFSTHYTLSQGITGGQTLNNSSSTTYKDAPPVKPPKAALTNQQYHSILSSQSHEAILLK
jgi:hypothetical protein